MKFQYLAVIFVIIILPITLVLSFYTQTQIDIMNRQSEYKSKLSDATYDAITAFQINTTNSYYSSVSDSKIRDIEASVNSFYNSLTTSLDFTKSDLQAYVPAIVYTLYDGYYIYGKRYNVYENPEINDSGELTNITINTDTENITDPDLYEYGLKPFVYYSCQYQKGSDSFIVNFTLDNFISIYGTIGGTYYNKSGYLIQIDKNQDEFDGTYKGVTIANTTENLTEYLKFTKTATNQPTEGVYQYVVHQNQKVYINQNVSDTDENRYFWYDQGVAHSIQGEVTRAAIAETIRKSSSYEFYEQAYEFSKWVYDNLKDIKQANIRTVVRKANGDIEIDTGGTNLQFDAGNESIFDTSKDPEDPESIFNQHRIAVIKNSIETNLIVAINSYNSNANSYDYALPRLEEEDWEKVVNNVCMITFMQGMPLGGKYFNDYVVVPNDKNNEFVDNDAIYFMTDDGKYHLANCALLVEDTNWQDRIIGGYINTAFQRQTVDSQYYYRHVYQNTRETPYSPCYYCLVNSTGKYDIDEDIVHNIAGNIDRNGQSYNITTLRQKYFSILGREKNNLYKTNN